MIIYATNDKGKDEKISDNEFFIHQFIGAGAYQDVCLFPKISGSWSKELSKMEVKFQLDSWVDAKRAKNKEKQAELFQKVQDRNEFEE